MNAGERMNKNVERGRATRAHVVEVATRLFAEHGYDGTSIETVQASAGVSRGSLYHHFPGKEALFWAVLEEVGARIAQQGEDIARDAPDPVAMLRAGALAWIRLAGDPVVRQIMLIDAPAVLGWQRWRELDEQGPLGAIRDALGYAAETGRIEHHHVDTFAHIVLAAANEVAMMIARADDPATALTAGESAFAEFLDRLLGETSPAAYGISRSLPARERSGQAERWQDAVLEPGHGADLVAGQGEHVQAGPVADAGRGAQVGAERGLAVGSRRHQVEPAARAEQAGTEAGHDLPALVLKGHRRHRDEHVAGQQDH
jgi:AcrR family transcriptional regulator